MLDLKKDDFHKSGPKYLTPVDWNRPLHRRAVAASLVQGIYVRERDRQRSPSGSLATPWWDFFQFQLIKELVDDADQSIFGGIYEYKPFNSVQNINALKEKVPKYVIAFRGTIVVGQSALRDLKLDADLAKAKLHEASRCRIAMQAVEDKVRLPVGASNNIIWLAGHSLGSAVATFVGRSMAKKGIFLESFLFDPPFVSAPTCWIENEKVKHFARASHSLIKVSLATVTGHSDDDFTSLSSWIPHLFVNSEDIICSEYIAYFEHRKYMRDEGVGDVESLATQLSLLSLSRRVIGKKSYPLHLLPSASLTINRSDTHEAHGICQWWEQDLDLQHERNIWHEFQKKGMEKERKEKKKVLDELKLLCCKRYKSQI